MGCVASKLEEEEEVVSICREKKAAKTSCKRRYALAEAHCRYFQSLYAVAATIKLFVARHSSPTSPFLITFPPPLSPTEQNVITNPIFLQQEPSESTTPHEAIACESCGSSTTSDSSEEETKEEEQREEQDFGYFYMQTQSPQTDFGWDFFNPFDTMRPEIVSGYGRSSDDDLRVVREEEGIPELEEEGDREGEDEEEDNGKAVVIEEKGKTEIEERGTGEVKVVDEVANRSQSERKGLTVIDTPERGNSRKLIQAITWHRSTSSSKPSSCKSVVASSSKSSSTWTEYKNDLFDEYGGMDAGSHSLTLGSCMLGKRSSMKKSSVFSVSMKAWLCGGKSHVVDVRGDDELAMDKTRAAVKDLHARILVAIRSAESISKRIEKLRDEELQPQIVELLKGLTHAWKIMLESHETQNKILFEVKSFACPTYGKFCNDSHRLATLQLEAEIHNWRACFTEYVAAQKAYVEALHGWLTKFLVPEVEFCSRGRSSVAAYRATGPPLLMICHNWLSSMENLPGKAVSYALKSFSKDVRALWTQQGEEQQQKRKVDNLAKEVDRRTLALQKTETRFLESKLIEYETNQESEHLHDHLTEKKDQLDIIRKKLNTEKEKHHNCMQETQRMTLSGFQTGFSTVFESLTDFSKASMKMYNDLVNCSESAGKIDNQSHIEGAQGEEIGSR
ncbi:hypothetical protein GH714_029128 [Hevea brasiliensis]|uniref:DUF632 domain-containing protein n=1 Tax=Hevea brasiliensis TaxID=3981 RepID=A0A6A6N917_HEVBR|nr:hypothetical protein GH714_029128 [Hevea brasiliensis]